jgi:2-methylcitrate dehydratase PrpD
MRETEKIVEYIVDTTYEDFPRSVIEKAKLHILDAIGCAIGAISTETSRVVTDLVSTLEGIQESTIIGKKRKVPCIYACFSNAFLINALDYDDVGTGDGSHPGSTIIGTALATGEKVQATGKKFLTAVVLGYEVSERVAESIQPSWRSYLKVHGRGYQTFAAVTTAGKLLGLDMNSMLDAFGISGAFSPVPIHTNLGNPSKIGILEHRTGWVKDNVSWPALVGAFAALLAQRGFVGNRSIFDGKGGYWIMAGSDKCNFQKLVDFSDYKILKVALKPYPCCRWIHTTLDAVNEIMERQHLTYKDIKKVVIRTAPLIAERFADYHPRTIVDAQFSIPYAVAATILAVPHQRWYAERYFPNRTILGMAKNVHLQADFESQKKYVRRRRHYSAEFMPTTVEIDTHNGNKYIQKVDYSKGGTKKPLTAKEIQRKFENITEPFLSEDGASKIIKNVQKLEELDNIQELIRCLNFS